MLFFIENTDTGLLAAEGCTGEHDGRFTDDARRAAAFDTRGEASDFCQNFGPSWQVVEY